MTRVRTVAVLALLMLSTGSVLADVRADEKTRVEFAGALGRMVNLFGGKAAREGITSMVAVKGDRKATLNDTTGQIIDLSEEKVYDLDLKKKTYKVTTFAELRRRMEEAQEERPRRTRAEGRADRNRRRRRATKRTSRSTSTSRTRVRKKRSTAFDTHEAVMTIIIREKGKTLEESGGLVLTTDMWLTAKIAAMSDVMDFDMRYAQKLYGPMVAGASAEEMSTALALYPMMTPAMGRCTTEGAKLAGTAIMTTTTFEGVKSAEQIAAEQKQRRTKTSRSARARHRRPARRLRPKGRSEEARRRRPDPAHDGHDEHDGSSEGGHRRERGRRRRAGRVQGE